MTASHQEIGIPLASAQVIQHDLHAVACGCGRVDQDLSAPQLLARRRAAAARLGDVEQVLAGTLTEQARRCGRPGCRCATGEPHGPYAYFTPRPQGRGRARYVPAALAQVVRRCLHRGEQAEAVLAEISAINAELLARRELQ